jgi:uncharacterized membrane protein (UPF0182 family)
MTTIDLKSFSKVTAVHKFQLCLARATKVVKQWTRMKRDTSATEIESARFKFDNGMSFYIFPLRAFFQSVTSFIPTK